MMSEMPPRVRRISLRLNEKSNHLLSRTKDLSCVTFSCLETGIKLWLEGMNIGNATEMHGLPSSICRKPFWEIVCFFCFNFSHGGIFIQGGGGQTKQPSKVSDWAMLFFFFQKQLDRLDDLVKGWCVEAASGPPPPG